MHKNLRRFFALYNIIICNIANVSPAMSSHSSLTKLGDLESNVHARALGNVRFPSS